MKLVIRWRALALFLCVPAFAEAWDYSPLTLYRLLTDADIVVFGDIGKLSEDSYELAVRRTYRPADAPEVMQVARTDTNEISERRAEYREGQSVYVFAKRGTRVGDPIRPLGKAGEGELPAEEGTVYVRELSRPPERLGRATQPAGTVTAYRLDAEEFDDAIAGFEQCYRSAGSDRLTRVCNDDQQDAYRSKNWLAAHLAGIADRLTE